MDRAIPIKSMVLGVAGIAIILVEPFGYWSLVVGLSVSALAGYFTFQAQNPGVESKSAKPFTFKEELSVVEECKGEARKSLFGAGLVISGLLIMYFGSKGELWLAAAIIGFGVVIVGAIKSTAYIGCVSRLNNRREGKF